MTRRVIQTGQVIVLGNEAPDWLRVQPDVELVEPDGAFPIFDLDDDTVVVTLHTETVTPATVDVVRRLLDAGVGITSVRSLAKSRYRIASLEGATEVPKAAGLFGRIVSRTIDIVGAIFGCLLLFVLLPFVAVAIWLDDRGPVLFKQERIGPDKRPFRIVKFRTMEIDAERAGPRWAEADDDRVTRVGAVLRKYRIDEFPQFINVLKGDMSLIGPRPERPAFVELLEQHVPQYDVRHSVRPGMTGWGTLNVGYGNSVKAKYLTHQYDMFHLIHRTLRFDIEILFKTTKLVLTAPSTIDHMS